MPKKQRQFLYVIEDHGRRRFNVIRVGVVRDIAAWDERVATAKRMGREMNSGVAAQGVSYEAAVQMYTDRGYEYTSEPLVAPAGDTS